MPNVSITQLVAGESNRCCVCEGFIAYIAGITAVKPRPQDGCSYQNADKPSSLAIFLAACLMLWYRE